jgi:hypothetical protein
MSFVKQTLAGLMLSGSTHAPSGPICEKQIQKEKKIRHFHKLNHSLKNMQFKCFQEKISQQNPEINKLNFINIVPAVVEDNHRITYFQ